MASGYHVIHPITFELFATLQPEYITMQGTSFPYDGYAFATSEKAKFSLPIPEFVSGLLFDIHWISRAGSASNNVLWSITLAAQTPGDAQSALTKSLATANTGQSTVNSTASGPNKTTITQSNIDSAAAGDLIHCVISRGTPTGSDMTGDALLHKIQVYYTI